MQFSIEFIKKVIIHFHRLDCLADSKKISKLDILEMIKKIGVIQIDSISVVHRSQYLVLWTRLGNYDISLLDELIYKDKILFEYWLHCASIIHIDLYKYRTYKMQEYYENDILKDRVIETQELLNFIRLNNGAKSSDFKEQKKFKGWWSWKPSKSMLESLYNSGKLMVDNRINFERVYNLKELVLPKNKNKNMNLYPSKNESIKFLLEYAAKKIGVFFLNDICYFSFIKKSDANLILEELIKEGFLLQISVMKEKRAIKMFIHKDSVKIIEQLQLSKSSNVKKVFFLSPFDSFLWSKKRLLEIFNFHQVFEAYKKIENRKWGYFCLPILYGSNLVGRVDFKMNRKIKELFVLSIHFEDGFKLTKHFTSEFKRTLISFMRFNKADTLKTNKKSDLNDMLFEI